VHSQPMADEDEDKRMIEQMRYRLSMKDQFLTAVAHELRNPLAPIAYALELLDSHAEDVASVRTARGIIARQLAQLKRFVDDLLDLSRSSNGQLQLQCTKVDLADAATLAVETAHPLITAREQTLLRTVTPGDAIVEGDLGRLTQVLTNLLINAAKFTEKRGRIWLTVTTDAQWAIASVRDTGIGIAPEMLPAIFDVYVQAAQSARASQTGVGLGLTLSRRLVELHGGALSAHSEGLGKGSEFQVRLPLVAPYLAGAQVR
jgi:signal transduction histidine kinase